MCAYFARLEVSSVIYLSLPSRQTSHGDDEMKDMLADLQAVSQRRRAWRAGRQADRQASMRRATCRGSHGWMHANSQKEQKQASKTGRGR